MDLVDNRLASVPETLGDLEGLSDFLYLHYNQLAWLPTSLSLRQLTNLRELHFRKTKLESLPESVGALRQLRRIDLRGTPLRHLHGCLAASPRLEKLDLRWVDTLAMPDWLADLEARGCVIYG